MKGKQDHIKAEEKKKHKFFWIVALIFLAITIIRHAVSGGSIFLQVSIAMGITGVADILRAAIKKEKPFTLSFIFVGFSWLVLIAFFLYAIIFGVLAGL